MKRKTSHNNLVTVYITNYNYENYIKQAIESVLCQTYKNYELIIIDDGSTDDSIKVINNYITHPKIRVIYLYKRPIIKSPPLTNFFIFKKPFVEFSKSLAE